jgi:hypothetical protein
MRRYVILTHDHPHLHWDLMLEVEGALRTWRLAAPPEPDAGIAAEPLGDHRLAYLDYEGPVGGDRGYVTRWDAGVLEWLNEELSAPRVRLAGEKLGGELSLEPGLDGRLVCRYVPGNQG